MLWPLDSLHSPRDRRRFNTYMQAQAGFAQARREYVRRRTSVWLNEFPPALADLLRTTYYPDDHYNGEYDADQERYGWYDWFGRAVMVRTSIPELSITLMADEKLEGRHKHEKNVLTISSSPRMTDISDVALRLTLHWWHEVPVVYGEDPWRTLLCDHPAAACLTYHEPRIANSVSERA